eukprot:174400_1
MAYYDEKQENANATSLTCTKNHKLTSTSPNDLAQENAGYTNGYICNECRQSFKNEYSFHCWQCQYDLCKECIKNDRDKIGLEKEKKVRDLLWNLYYFDKWGQFALKSFQQTFVKFFQSPSFGKINDALAEKEAYKKAVNKFGQQAANQATIKAVNYMVAQQIVANTIKGGAIAGGRRGAIVVAQQSAGLVAAQSANAAIVGVSSLGVGVSAQIGEALGGKIADGLGIENHNAKNAFALGGSIGGGALAGAAVGGPFGAAIGAAVGGGSFAIGQSISGLSRTGKGPNDNWCYIEIGNIGNKQVCCGTYAGDDTVYWKTYWKETKGKFNNWVMSAGNPQKTSFQVCIWYGNNVIKHYNKVYYRDRFIITSNNNGKTLYVTRCFGELHGGNAGQTEQKIYKTWLG